MNKSLSIDQRTVTYREILLFWLPLAVMWLIMGVEQPAMTAVIARMSDATRNLAAFGVAFAMALVIESPILQLLSAATALTDDRRRYRRLLHFMHLSAAGLTLLHVVLGATPLFGALARIILRVPEEVIEPSRVAFLTLAPFAAAVGYRRLWQGVLIKFGRTGAVPLTMISRLLATTAVLALGFAFDLLPGNILASVALLAGVVAGAVSAYLFYRRGVAEEIPENSGQEELSWRSLLSFYVPLSLTSIIFLAARPVLTFGIARSLLPLPSLAVWPVLQGFLFLFNSVALSYQEAAVALLARNRENRSVMDRFAWHMGLLLTGVFLLAGITPLGSLWFTGVSGLGPGLLELTEAPLLLLAAVPFLVARKSWYRGELVHLGRTRVLAWAVSLHTVVLLLLVWLLPLLLPMEGTLTAAISFAVAMAVENVILRAGAGYRSMWRKRPEPVS
ncbi:MAG: hypothetical protein ACLFQZ_04710 [Spirochaetaceae bacterium]